MRSDVGTHKRLSERTRFSGYSHGNWKFSSRHSRKSGRSNIFTGVNLHQLQRLFRTAGDRNAEHREESGMEREDEAGLAQALVGLRVRARNKAGIRVEGHREHKWLRASGYVR
uniref:Arginine vasopressin-induced protein 1 n=1 Tax=Amphiprion ocellaris TaxID=80972 RepID=A0A3Q1B004_AMPOC